MSQTSGKTHNSTFQVKISEHKYFFQMRWTSNPNQDTTSIFLQRFWIFLFLLNVLFICTIPNLYYFWFDFLLLFPSVCVCFFSIMKPCTEQTKDPFSYWISLESQSVFTPSFPGFIILLLRENNSMLKIEQKVQFLGCWFSIREKKFKVTALLITAIPRLTWFWPVNIA